MRRWIVGSVVGLACLVCLGVGADRAGASTSGPCTATINGIAASTLSSTDTDDAIQVAADGSIDAVVSSAQPIGHYEVELRFLGLPWTVAEDDADGTSWTKTIDVGDYARLGRGLYEVRVTSGGSAPCSGAVLIEITGSPFGSVAGWLGLLGAGAGAGAIALVATQGRRPFAKISSPLGALGGLGVVILLQQFAVTVPSGTTTLVALGVGGALPLVARQVGLMVTKGRP